MSSSKKRFDIGVKLINKFSIEADTKEEAIEIVKNKKDREILTDSLLSIDYVYES
tara:strand:+ start:50 stop:214 length:165 start_codon:yes stop_codon:yes gene_type:complete